MQNETFYTRTEMVFSSAGVENLKNSHVAVFGLGGVGSYAVESLVRSGVGALTIVDFEEYSPSNLNRQLYATLNTIGVKKVDACKNRILEINKDLKVYTHDLFISAETLKDIDFCKFDYVIDAIDTVSGKLEIIKKAKQNGVKVISAMSAGNKLDATAFKVSDIKDTKTCPLCKVMRKLLKEQGIDGVKVVYSEEQPVKPISNDENASKQIASVSFVPSVMGLILSGEVIKDLALKN